VGLASTRADVQARVGLRESTIYVHVALFPGQGTLPLPAGLMGNWDISAFFSLKSPLRPFSVKVAYLTSASNFRLTTFVSTTLVYYISYFCLCPRPSIALLSGVRVKDAPGQKMAGNQGDLVKLKKRKLRTGRKRNRIQRTHGESSNQCGKTQQKAMDQWINMNVRFYKPT